MTEPDAHPWAVGDLYEMVGALGDGYVIRRVRVVRLTKTRVVTAHEHLLESEVIPDFCEHFWRRNGREVGGNWYVLRPVRAES